ncbi:MAG TPA: hypothetical protein VGQ91_13110 [Ideonella sp.]|nr:hypothetical protein [Ideonella sp.]
MHNLLKVLTWPLKWLLALVILFEEWGWEPLQRLMERMGQALGLTALAAWVQRLPPYAALALFALPALALLPIKLLALWLIAQGRTLLGALVIVVAQLVGTAILARLFTLTQPALMRLGWFARLYGRWSAWKQALLAWARASTAWQQLSAWRHALRERWRRWRSAFDQG